MTEQAYFEQFTGDVLICPYCQGRGWTVRRVDEHNWKCVMCWNCKTTGYLSEGEWLVEPSEVEHNG